VRRQAHLKKQREISAVKAFILSLLTLLPLLDLIVMIWLRVVKVKNVIRTEKPTVFHNP
jgi:hypothetical protein